MSRGYYILHREEKQKIKSHIGLLIYQELCSSAFLVPRWIKLKNKISVQLQAGQCMSSAEIMCQYLGSIELKTSLSTVQRQIRELEILGLIEIEVIKSNNRKIGSVFTICAYRDQLRDLQPQGVQRFADQSNTDSDQLTDQLTDQLRSLQPQGMQPIRDQLTDQLTDQYINYNNIYITKTKEIKNISSSSTRAREKEQPEDLLKDGLTHFAVIEYFQHAIRKRFIQRELERLLDYESDMSADVFKFFADYTLQSGADNKLNYWIKMLNIATKERITTIEQAEKMINAKTKGRRENETFTKTNARDRQQIKPAVVDTSSKEFRERLEVIKRAEREFAESGYFDDM